MSAPLTIRRAPYPDAGPGAPLPLLPRRWACRLLTVCALGACARPAPQALGESTADGPGLSAEIADVGTLRDRLPAPDDADLVLLYGGEQEGVLGTCGCQVRPRGSLARVEGYRAALARVDDTPRLLVNTGHWLDDTIDATGRIRADVSRTNAFVVEALAGWDVLNLAVPDLPWIVQEGALPPQAVSANLRPAAFDLPAYVVVERGGLRVAVTGVTADAPTFLATDAYTLADPVAALTALVPTLDADVVVVLAWGTRRDTAAVAAVPGVDVLVEAGAYSDRWDPYLGARGAVWVRSDYQTQRLGELRLRLGDGVVAARDRLVDLDDAIPADRSLRRLERRAGRP